MKTQCHLYIETFGCQMNTYDSQMISGLLEDHGYVATSNPQKADAILVNTCSVRERAEVRAMGRIRELSKQKQEGAKLAVVGCMAQRLAQGWTKANVGVDLVVGPDQYDVLPGLLRETNGKCRIAVGRSEAVPYENLSGQGDHPTSASIAISRGCSNFCSYCVVPYVRGPERHRPMASILREAALAIDRGAGEIVLLGQNVNSYRDQGKGFGDLLKALNGVAGDFRIRFLTSHPKDLSPALISAMAEAEKVCEHLHLPVQAGSNTILDRMNRGYTTEEFLEKVHDLRKRIPNVSLTSDIMVGFPGESMSDFAATLDLAKQAQFDEAYTYRYSVRPGTAAARMEDTVPEEEKIRRLNQLIEFQRAISLDRLRSRIGSTEDVLFEKKAPRGEGEWWGKTRGGRPVVVPSHLDLKGTLKEIVITGTTGATLRGVMKEYSCAS